MSSGNVRVVMMSGKVVKMRNVKKMRGKIVKMSVCVSVCLFPHHIHTTEPIFMKFCMGVLLHPGSVLGYIV